MHTFIERRTEDREEPWSRLLDLHYELRRDHNQLKEKVLAVDKKTDIIAIGMQALVDNQKDNHQDVMSAVIRRETDSSNILKIIAEHILSCSANTRLWVKAYLAVGIICVITLISVWAK